MQCHKNSHYCVYTVAGFGMKRWRQGKLLGEKDNVTNSHMSASLLNLNGFFFAWFCANDLCFSAFIVLEMGPKT